ncbi:MAG: hypothetical protein HQ518_32685 [Rhodopirellula sp.]|nr:hypothetical protein [Rhodopirellula sp.]
MALGFALVVPLLAQAAGPLDLIPADATAVIRLKSPEETIGKVGNFANAVQPGLGFMVQGQAPGLGVVISNPTLGGVDLKQDWYVAIFAVKGAEPAVVFVIPATDVKALQSGVGEKFTFASKDSWVAYSQDEAVMELVEECISGGADAASGAIDKRSSALFGDSDLAAWVNVAGLVEAYRTELDGADDQLDALLEGLTAQVPPTPGMNMAAVLSIYGDLGHGALRAVRDSQSFSIGISVSNSAITIDELLVVKARTATDNYLASQKTSKLDVLGQLPQNKHGYMAMHCDFKSLMEWGLQVSTKVIESDEETQKKMAEMVAELNQVEFGQIGWGFSLDDRDIDVGLIRGYSISNARPASKLREAAQKMGSAYKMELPGMKQEVTVKKDAESYDGLSADVITIKQTFDTEDNPAAEFQNLFQEMLHGKDGMVQRLVVKSDDVLIQSIGGTQATMKETLAAYDAAAATKESDNQKNRAGLLEEANIIGQVDLPNILIVLARAVLATEKLPIPVPIKAEQLAGLSVPRSYIGFSAGTVPQGVQLRTTIEAKTLQGFFQIFTYFQQQMQQPPR